MLLEFIGEMLTLIGGLIVAYFVYILVTKKDDAPSEDSPAMAHTALREIVERAVEEAKKLPSLDGSPNETGKPQESRNILEQSYEDLLATAILNKVIEKFQKEQVDGNSNVLHGKPVSAIKCALTEHETRFDEGVEEGCSSLEPLSQDECSSECSASCPRHSRNQPESLSLTIEERIEEVTTTYASDEDHRDNDVLAIRNAHRVPFPELGMDIIDPSQESSDESQDEPDTPTPQIGLVSPIESWEENWLFQKKRVQTQADPVSMLVPHPSADFKALIGDKDAEETSDLSECSSAQSDEEIEKELMEAINNVVPRSPGKKEYQNGLDNPFQSHNGASTKKSPIEIVSTDNYVTKEKIRDSGKTDSEAPMNGIVKENEKENTKSKEVQMELLQKVENEVEAKDDAVEKSILDFGRETEVADEVEIKGEKPVLQTSVINNFEKIETEEETANKESKDDVAENATNASDLNDPPSKEQVDPTENNKSIPKDPTESLISSHEENVSDVPKTPTCTPTRTSVTDVFAEDENDAEEDALKEERGLSSLECAKQKLMTVEDPADAFKEEEKPSSQKTDLHAEDIQQESEYTEHYDIATQRHLDSLTKTDVAVSENGTLDDNGIEESKCREAVALAKAESASHLPLQNGKSEDEVRLATPPRPGTIAEREHKKWENAPPIENNPYSEENIQKRLWERQYSRRASDIPGMHTELPKTNGADLEAVLMPQEPDMKRFGRDYYINDSRASSNEKGRRSAASTYSRPSSSLSQRSSSTSAEQEQQVSFQLDKFEAASLRGSLSRWTYRDPYSSPHFAINPLLRMDLDEKRTIASREKDKRVVDQENSDETAFFVESDAIAERTELETGDNNSVDFTGSARVAESLMNDLNTVTKMSQRETLMSKDSSKNLVFNPLYEAEQTDPPGKCNPDRDSGIYSIEHEIKDSRNQDQDRYRRLWINDWDDETKENQILSINGRKYWSFNGCKYHTFGGIKSLGMESPDDSEEDNAKPETSDESLNPDVMDFSKLKVQTFGGIKRSEKTNAKGVPPCKGTKLRSSLRINKNKRTRSSLHNSAAQIGNKITDNINMKDTADENFDSQFIIRDPQPSDTDFRNESRSKSLKGRSRSMQSYYQSSSDDWQDEDIHVSSRELMTKFLEDASKKSRRSDDSKTSKRKMLENSVTRIGTKHRVADDNESLKLERPIVPEVVERSFETLQDLRAKRKKRKNCESSGKKLGVRSLSDVTIR